MPKLKFSIRSFIEEAWADTKQELHKLGFAIFENAKTNEVVLIHDAELAGIAAVEGNKVAVFEDAKNAAITLMENHAPQATSQVAPQATSQVAKLTGTTGATETEEKHDL